MKLLTLTIRNFRVLRKADLVFADQVIGITGPNGAGKSSLVEAIAWALYGTRVARSGKEEIRSTYASADDNCTVVLGFEIGREHYRLERSLIGRTERSEVILYRGGSRESSGTNDTEKYVAHLLGLDWRGFITSFLARQQELNALANLTPGDRRAQLAGMLGIDRLDRAIRLVKDDRRAAEQGAVVLQQQTAVLDDIRVGLKQLREHVVELENQYVTLDGACKERARQLAESDAANREHEARFKACSHIQTGLDSARLSLQHLAQQMEHLAGRQARLHEVQRELDELGPEVLSLDGLQTELAELKRRRDTTARFQQLTDQAAAWRSELEQAERTLADCRRDREELERLRAGIPADLGERLKEVTAQLDDTRRQWADKKGALAAEEKTVAQLTGQLESIQQVGPDTVCERCHRPFGSDLPTIQEHLAAELSTTEADCIGRRDELARLFEQGQALKNETDRLRQLDQQRGELELKERNLQSRLTDLQTRRERLMGQQEPITVQLKMLGPTDYDPGRLQELTEQVVRLESLRLRLEGLRGELKDEPTVLAEIVRVQEQRLKIEVEVEALERELKVIGFDQEAYDVASRRLTEQQVAANEARLNQSEAGNKLEMVRREIRIKEEELGRLEEIGRQLELVRTDQYYAEKLVTLFGDFRKFTISRIRPRLAELSSQLMAEMSGGRYSLVELDEDYNLQVMDNGAYFGIDRFSGGEKDLASLCLRLSISLALTESAGLDRSFIILDEVFGSQDSGRRELIFEALANLKTRFPQMILITHLEELKNKVETIVELIPQPGGWSEVRVNGGLV
jgi:exonuclease SbcC